jgi:ABC-type multidrug transport system ATPase subunit
MNVLSIRGLTKQYGQLTAVNHLSLDIQKGDVFGILGPNGSGKTTTLGVALGITNPTQGECVWFDNQYGKKALHHVGALLETPNFYPYMNALDNLKIVAHIKESSKTDFEHLLRLVNLFERRTTPFNQYSLGMKQRLAIAATMVGDPDVLIFDEPTNGLDPVGIAEVRNTLQGIAAQGKTVIMASHILDEVEKVCSHVAIIKNGNLLATGTVGSIINKELSVEISAHDMNSLKEALTDAPFVSKITDKHNVLLVGIKEGATAYDLSRWISERGIVATHLMEKKVRLEDEFLAITAKG